MRDGLYLFYFFRSVFGEADGGVLDAEVLSEPKVAFGFPVSKFAKCSVDNKWIMEIKAQQTCLIN